MPYSSSHLNGSSFTFQLFLFPFPSAATGFAFALGSAFRFGGASVFLECAHVEKGWGAWHDVPLGFSCFFMVIEKGSCGAALCCSVRWEHVSAEGHVLLLYETALYGISSRAYLGRTGSGSPVAQVMVVVF